MKNDIQPGAFGTSNEVAKNINNSGQANKATVWFVAGFLVLVTAAVIIAGAYSSGTSSNTASSTFVSTTAPAITAADWTEGNPNAKVSLIEYGDFECPACGEYFPVVQQIFQNYSSTVLFVFRNLIRVIQLPLRRAGVHQFAVGFPEFTGIVFRSFGVSLAPFAQRLDLACAQFVFRHWRG